MVKFAPDRERWGHFACDMEFDQMAALLDLVKTLPNVMNLEFREIPVPGSSFAEPKPKVPQYKHHGDLRIWESHVKSVFMHAKANGGSGELRHDDAAIANALAACGRKASGVSPFLSYLRRSGLIVRTGKGLYRLP